MKRPSGRLIAISILGIISGLYVVFIFIQPDPNDDLVYFVYLGVLYIVLNILLLFFNSIRKVILIISWLYLCLNITGVLFGFPIDFRGQSAIFLGVMFPLFLYSLIAILYLK